jgi:hypothetical protein
MEETTTPSPEAVRRAKFVYCTATVGITVASFALYLLLVWKHWGGFLLPEGPFKQFVGRTNGGVVFLSLGMIAATAISRRLGTSLEARWTERVIVRRKGRAVTKSESTSVRRDRSTCVAGMVLGVLLGGLYSAIHVFHPERSDPGTDLCAIGFGLVGLWSCILWEFGDWVIARAGGEGITFNTGAPWLPGKRRRKHLSWPDIGGIEMRHVRTVTGQATVQNLYVWDEPSERWWKIPLTMSVLADRTPFVQRVREEANGATIDLAPPPVENRYTASESTNASVNLGKMRR